LADLALGLSRRQSPCGISCLSSLSRLCSLKGGLLLLRTKGARRLADLGLRLSRR
jgi:hypothetical protein